MLDCWLTGANFVGMSKNSFFADDVQEETSREPDLPNKVYFENGENGEMDQEPAKEKKGGWNVLKKHVSEGTMFLGSRKFDLC